MPSQLPELSLEAHSQCFKQFAFHVSQQASPLYAQLSVTVADDLELLILAEVSLRLISLQRSIFCCSKGCSIPSQRSILVSLSSLSAMQIPIPPSAHSAGEGRRFGALTSTVQISCTLRGNRLPPFPVVLPKVAWRMGIDLHPLSVPDPEAKLWLLALIWPENTQKAERLQQALHLIEQDPPSIIAGDALALLPSVLATVPQETTLCIFHSFIVNQFSQEAREQLTLLLAEWAAKRLLFRVSLKCFEGEDPLLELTT